MLAVNSSPFVQRICLQSYVTAQYFGLGFLVDLNLHPVTGTWKWSRSFVSGTGQHRHSTISSGSITFAPVSGKPNTYTGSGSATLTTNATNAHKRHSKSHSVTVKNGTVSGSRVSFSFHRGDGYNWTVSGTFSADGASFSATGKPIGKAGVFPERTFHKQ